MASASSSSKLPENGADESASARQRWRVLLFFLATLAILLVPSAYLYQGRLLPCGAALEPGPATWSGEWWLCPIERNRAERRQGLDLLADLTAIHIHGDGQRGWAVGRKGALLRTEDGGLHWDRVGDDLSGLGVASLNALAFAADGLRGWAAGDDGVILSTRDGGKTWELLYRDSGRQWVQLQAAPDGQRLWGLSAEGMVYASSDAGKTWSVQQHRLNERILSLRLRADGQRIWAVDRLGVSWDLGGPGETWRARAKSSTTTFTEDRPLSSPGALLLSGDGVRAWAKNPAGHLQITQDGGLSWQVPPYPTELPMESLRALHALDDGQRLWAVGKGGRIAVSRDGGQNWQMQNSPSTVDLEAVTFLPDGTKGWAVGSQGTVLSTTDGGQHWQVQQSSLRPTWGQVALMPDGRRAFVAGQPGSIQTSIDGGQTWHAQASGTREDLYRGFFLNDGRRAWLVGAKGTLSSTRDGGQSWQPQARGVTTVDLYGLVFLPDGMRGWAVGEEGQVLSTVDGGQNWQARRLGNDKESAPAFTGVYAALDGRRLWLVGSAGSIWLSEDGGVNWTTQASPVSTELLAVTASADGRRIWAVGEKGVLIRSTDAGKSWQALNPAPTDVALYAVSFHADGQRGWVAGDRGHLLYTRDGGVSWQKPSSLPAGVEAMLLASVSVLEDGLRGLAAGEEGLILATRDGGQSWTFASSGHARWPVPGFFVVLACLMLVLLACLLLMALRLRGPEVGLRGLLNARAEADAPISRAHQDKLNFRPVVDALSYFLRHQATQAPLTVALTAPWGQGKSSMMRMLEAKLQRGGLHTVWFNVWHHQKEPVLLAALLNALSVQAVPGWLTLNGWEFRSKLVWLRFARQPFLGLGPLLLWFSVTVGMPFYLLVGTLFFAFFGSETGPGSPTFSYVADGLLALAALVTGNPASEALMAGEWSKFLRETVGALGSEPAKIVPLLLTLWLLLSVFFLFSHFARAFPARPGALLSSLGPRFSIAAAEEQTGFRQRFRDHFLDVAQALRPGTLTVFIDDLDRCEPAKAAEMLEAVNYLSDAGPCFIVLGMAMEVVEAQLGETYKDLAQRKHDFDQARQAPWGMPAHVGERAASSVGGAGSPSPVALSSQQVQLSYARKYLEKLVQIYVPVPSVSEEGLAQLLAEAGEASDASPKRAAVARALALEEALAVFNRRFWAVLRFAVVLLSMAWLAWQASIWNEQVENRRSQSLVAQTQALYEAIKLRQPRVEEARQYAHWLKLDAQDRQASLASVQPSTAAADGKRSSARTQLRLAAIQEHQRLQRAGYALDQEQAWRYADEAQRLIDILQVQRRDQALTEARKTLASLDHALAAMEQGLSGFRLQRRAVREALFPSLDRTKTPAEVTASGLADANSPSQGLAVPVREDVARPMSSPAPIGSEWWALYLPLLAVMAAFSMGIYLSRQRQQIRATEAYEQALADCRPLLQKLESLRAPREIKRFMNLSRYLALRVNARNYAGLPSGLAWWPGLRERLEALLPDPPELPEHEVVALAALHLARSELAPQVDAVQWLCEPACRASVNRCTAELRLLAQHLGGSEAQAQRDPALVRRFLATMTEMQTSESAAMSAERPPA